MAEERQIKHRKGRGTASRMRKEEVEVEGKAEEKGEDGLSSCFINTRRCHSLSEEA